MTRYALAPDGVYRSFQGEGALAGEPMVFVRLAGCSVGCPNCDTDYRVARRAEAHAIAAEAAAVRGHARRLWLTGGEPTDRDLGPLVEALRGVGGFASIALATSGARPVRPGLFEWISVSPHAPGRPAQHHGHEVKLVAGLNGLDLADCDPRDYLSFPCRYVSPAEGAGPEVVAACREWAGRVPGWRLGGQMHKVAWGVA